MRRLSQTERVELSDQRMIKTAVQLIVKQGISSMMLTEVGLQAGYSRGLPAVRFGTKAELLRRIVRYVLSGWIARVTELTRGKRGLAALLAAIDAQYAWMEAEPDEMRALYTIFFHSIDPDADYRANVSQTLMAQRADLAQWFLEARERGETDPNADPLEEALQLLSVMLGVVYQSLMDPSLDVSRLHEKLKDNLVARLKLAPRKLVTRK